MTALDSILLSSFEDWANARYGEGTADGWDGVQGRYSDTDLNDDWQAYKAGFNKLLESLVLGVEATSEGAAVVLMAKVKAITLVLKSKYAGADKPVYGRGCDEICY